MTRFAVVVVAGQSGHCNHPQRDLGVTECVCSPRYLDGQPGGESRGRDSSTRTHPGLWGLRVIPVRPRCTERSIDQTTDVMATLGTLLTVALLGLPRSLPPALPP